MKLLALLALPLSLAAQSSAPALLLDDASGNRVEVARYEAAATAVIFISTECPVSNRYNERLEALHKEYSPRGVRFFFVNANHNESRAAIEEHRRKSGFTFDVFKDPENQTADRFGARVTPEAFLIGRDGKIHYHGRIDDSQFPARLTENTLRLALDAVLQGKPVEKSEARALGCTIKRAPKS